MNNRRICCVSFKPPSGHNAGDQECGEGGGGGSGNLILGFQSLHRTTQNAIATSERGAATFRGSFTRPQAAHHFYCMSFFSFQKDPKEISKSSEEEYTNKWRDSISLQPHESGWEVGG